MDLESKDCVIILTSVLLYPYLKYWWLPGSDLYTSLFFLPGSLIYSPLRCGWLCDDLAKRQTCTSKPPTEYLYLSMPETEIIFPKPFPLPLLSISLSNIINHLIFHSRNQNMYYPLYFLQLIISIDTQQATGDLTS